jgi:hypothetical protein
MNNRNASATAASTFSFAPAVYCMHEIVCRITPALRRKIAPLPALLDGNTSATIESLLPSPWHDGSNGWLV